MQSPYEIYNNEHGVRISYILTDEDRRHDASVGLLSYDSYLKRAYRKKDFRLKEGRGFGNEALVRWAALTREEQTVLIDKFGDPKKVAHPLEKHFEIDGTAKTFYDTYRFAADGQYIKTETQKQRYTTNASVLNALIQLKAERTAYIKGKGGSTRKIWETLINDVATFNEVLSKKYDRVHSLPNSPKLRVRLNEFIKHGYASLIDGRNKNSNAQTATPLMIQLWKDIYAGQPGQKPNHLEVWAAYDQFLQGRVEFLNNDTGELYNRNNEEFAPVSAKTVYRYQNMWANRITTNYMRAGNRQQYLENIPSHRRKRPEHSNVLLSIDDRQPKFEYAPGKRMWGYWGVDVCSQAITCWVFGDTKEGIITDFYQELARIYTEEWQRNLPYELECESSLNSSFRNTFLQNGAMFQRVKMYANKARSKYIERVFRDIALRMEKKVPGFKARPFARAEANQPGPDKQIYYTKSEIILIAKRVIYDWNNELHPNQQLYPGMSRWDVFMDKQHPAMDQYPTNWAAFLPLLGEAEKSTMRAGRIQLKDIHRMVGMDGKVALGPELIRIMKQIEGQRVQLYYLRNAKGNVLKTLVYTLSGQLVCELLDDKAYNHAALERTEQDMANFAINNAYEATVTKYIQETKKEISHLTVIEQPKPAGRFVMPGLDIYQPSERETVILPELQEDMLVPVETYQRGKSIRETY